MFESQHSTIVFTMIWKSDTGRNDQSSYLSVPVRKLSTFAYALAIITGMNNKGVQTLAVSFSFGTFTVWLNQYDPLSQLSPTLYEL